MTEPENQNPYPKMGEAEKKEVKEDKYAIKYPMAGYAPGNYMNICGSCKKEFMGDKRAVQCELCALRLTARAYNQLQEEQSASKMSSDDNEGCGCTLTILLIVIILVFVYKIFELWLTYGK